MKVCDQSIALLINLVLMVCGNSTLSFALYRFHILALALDLKFELQIEGVGFQKSLREFC